MTKNVSRLRIAIVFLLILLIPILLIYSIKIFNPDSPFFSADENRIRSYVESWHLLGAIVFILIQAFTVVFPPTPNLIPMIAGGVLFGTKLGILYSFTGIMIGATVNFYLTRVFGRRIVKKFLNKEEVEVIDSFSKKISWRFITLLPFIPGMYADLGGYSGGLSKITFKKYFLAIGFGYLILVSLANLLGGVVMQNQSLRFALILVLIVGGISIFLIPLVRFLRKKIL